MTEKKENKKCVMALGFFDGVHKGHQQLINITLEIAEKKDLTAALMTFKEHPLTKIFPRYVPKLLTDNREKIQLIRDCGIEVVYTNDFTEALMRLSPEDFVRNYLLDRYHVAHIVVGFNYTFGYQGKGTTDDLIHYGKKFGFDVTVVAPYVQNGVTVSSTMIRELISTGSVSRVEEYLGRPYGFTGEVISGKKLGRLYGIPTANLKPARGKIFPPSGVYYTKVRIGKETYDGLTNVGKNPTFKDHPYTIETYIYDFNGDIYGKKISIAFLARERGEIAFEGIERLFAHIRDDILRIHEKYRIHHEPFADAK